jgi:hypothetical protein
MTLFRIARRRRRVDASLVDKFRALPASNISDMLPRIAASGIRLRRRHAGGPMAGVALTVRTHPGCNLIVHKAFDVAEPGDVVVVDAGGDVTLAIIGEIMVRTSRAVARLASSWTAPFATARRSGLERSRSIRPASATGRRSAKAQARSTCPSWSTA